jgi:Uncharacterised nucleotidyltransferase
MALSKRARLREWLLSGSAPSPDGPADAEALVLAARAQGLAGRLRRALTGGPPGWPRAVLRRLGDFQRADLFRGIQQLHLARRVLSRLEERGLRALPLKGAALAEQLYGSVAERPMSDVDVLALDPFETAARTLTEAGLVEHDRADHARCFLDPDSGGVVELHHSVTSPPGFFPVESSGLWARSRTAPLQVPRLPSTEDLLVQLCLHAAFQHGFVLSLVQYLDFRRLLEVLPVDRQALLEIAATARAEVAVAASLRAAEVVVGAHVPTDLHEAFAARWPPGLRRWLEQRLQEPLSLVSPAPAALARVRWEIAAGRRLELVRRTLGAGAGPAETTSRSLTRGLVRAAGLARRWTGPTLRTWGGAAGAAEGPTDG